MSLSEIAVIAEAGIQETLEQEWLDTEVGSCADRSHPPVASCEPCAVKMTRPSVCRPVRRKSE